MIRSLLYVIILTVIVFIPFSLNQESKKKSYKRASRSVSVKIVTPQPPVKLKEIVKTIKPKPKKIIKKKRVIKKKIVPKPVIKKEPVVVKKEPLIQEKVVEEVAVVEEVLKQEVLSSVSSSKEDEYYALIYEEINKNKYYPKKSKKFKQEDTIPVSFVIDKEGYVSAFKIVRPSQYKALNKAVKKMFKKMRSFKKPPSGVKTPLEMTIEINFKLQKVKR